MTFQATIFVDAEDWDIFVNSDRELLQRVRPLTEQDALSLFVADVDPWKRLTERLNEALYVEVPGMAVMGVDIEMVTPVATPTWPALW